MECYRTNCKTKCDKYKIMGCIFRINEEQRDLIAKIKRQTFCKCGEILIEAKYGNEIIKLCTNCGVRGRAM